MLRSKQSFAVVICVAAALSLGQSAMAQQSQSGQLEEIVVTATKRESTAQNTPISLTAVSGADIQARGLTDLSNLVLSVPGVSVRTSGPGMTELEMRGVASVGGNSPTVGFYFDETSLTAPSATNEGKIVISPALYDLNRVEVLRGPQGTLYGSGSMGGTIKLVPNAPNPDAFDATEETTLADTDHGGFDYSQNAMVNPPFGDGLGAVRIVGSYSHDAGWIDRVVIEPGDFPLPTNDYTVRGNVLAAPVLADYHDVNDVDRTTVRISALLRPIDGLTITPTMFYQRMSSGGLPYIDSVPGTDAHYQPFDIAETYHDDFMLWSLNARYTTQSFEVSSTTSYWQRHEPLIQDTSESWETGLQIPGFTAAQGGIGAAWADEENPTWQTTEELRIQSVGDSKLKWLLGYYYSDFYSAWNITFPSTNGAALFGGNDLFEYFSPMPILQQSEFGELTYNITEPFAVTLGLRHYHYNAPVKLDQFGSLLPPPPTVTSTSENDQGFLPKVSLSYQVDKDLLLYTTAAEGFRPGGGTGPVPTAGPPTINCEGQLMTEYGSTSFVQGPVSFKSDHVWSYELGEKLRLADNRVTINGSVYYESWIGVQQVNGLSTCGYIYTANVGDAEVKGAELEIEAIVVPEVTVSANAGYADAALVNSTLIDAGFNPGTPIQQVPKWTSSESLAWRHGLAGGLVLSARIDNTYVGSRTDETYATNTLPSYDLANLRAGVEADRWSATLFLNNIADKRALLNNITQDAENLATFNRVAVSQPRTVGIDFNYRFGR